MNRFAFGVMLLAAAPVFAQAAPATPPVEDPAVVQAARRHFEQGVALYNDGNYAGALAEFEAAYHTRPAAAVLYNIGLTQKALFRYTEAIASLERYLAESPSLPPEARAKTSEIIQEMKALLADVTFQIAPAGAAVTVDGRLVGKAPLKTQLAAGNHVVEATADGYRPARRELLVAAGVPATVSLTLAAIPRTGRVHITASQPRALVVVDGRYYGYAPADVELTAGGHQLEVSAPRFDRFQSELVVAAGQSRTVDVTLARTPHIYEKWYFWTPLAVVAAGAAVGLGVGLTSREGPIPGTLNPGAGRVN